MGKYLYFAVLDQDADASGYTVTFPDLPGCITEGDDLSESLDMARDALEGYLLVLEDLKEEIPAASDWECIKAQLESDSSIITAIKADTRIARLREDNKAVKKTLTIPNWLDEAAKERNINFSQLLQEALKEALNQPSSKKEKVNS